MLSTNPTVGNCCLLAGRDWRPYGSGAGNHWEAPSLLAIDMPAYAMGI
jgi:hypothetical protein